MKFMEKLSPEVNCLIRHFGEVFPSRQNISIEQYLAQTGCESDFTKFYFSIVDVSIKP